MDRKKTAILLPWLKMGGTNKIALNFIRELSKYCDVTLILSENSGELLQDLPDNIHLVIDRMKNFRTLVREDLHGFRVGLLFRDCIYYVRVRTGRDSDDNFRYIVDRQSFVTDEVFDCAVSYHGQSPERLLNLLYRVQAWKKAVWIHGEMSFSDERIRGLIKYYRQIDRFFFVSNATKDAFCRKFPFAAECATVYYNPIDKKEILTKAEEKPEEDFSADFINILTVGRISKEKGQDMVPAAVRKLLDGGLRVRWYLIGDGDDCPRIKSLIRQYDVEDNVFLLGTRMNPYKYMRACDIYVQPSYTEGYSTTICEAGILGKPIIGTNTSGGIFEQLADGVNGIIISPDPDEIARAVAGLIRDEGLREKIGRNILEKDFEGRGEIGKFLCFLE